MSEDGASSRGSQPSIVESFRIEGLYGYRTISLTSEFAATILIAKNGSGKTTLLAALDAFLKCQFSRLRDVRFFRLACKLRGTEEIIVTHDDILAYADLSTGSQLELEARRLEIEPTALLTFIEDFSYQDKLNNDDEITKKIVSKHGYNRSLAQSFCQKLSQNVADSAPAVEAAIGKIKEALKGTEVVYLPTYRRIELSMNKSARVDQYGRARKFLPVTKSGLYAGEIQFGLYDILERLAELNQRIVFDSNYGYRELSASIINELIDGTFDTVSTTPANIPDKEELALFFSRLKEDPRRFGPYIELASIPNMEKIYTGQDISDERNKFLRYFLVKLNAVIQATRDIETLVSDFIDSCNKYLSFQDSSTLVEGDDDPSQGYVGDDKVLRLSRKDLKVYVESLHAGRTISLDALSSGEKQMISLFAKLFLYPKEKIILIDEPELSLSIDWQREILVDVINAPLCSQVIAITHSPFIFDNVLDPFARQLRSSVDVREDVPSEDNEEDLHG